MAKTRKAEEGIKRYEYYFLVDKGFVKVYAFNENDAESIVNKEFKSTDIFPIKRLGELIQDSSTNYRANLK